MRKPASHSTLLTALEARTAALAEQVRLATDQRSALAHCRATLTVVTAEMVQTRLDLIERTDDLILTRKELLSRTAELVQSRSSLVERTDALVQERAALAARMQEMLQLQETIQARAVELERMRLELRQATVTLTLRDEELNSLTVRTAADASALAAAHACIAALNIDLDDVRKTLVERTGRLEAALGIVEAADSKPLRWALRTKSRRLSDRIKPNLNP